MHDLKISNIFIKFDSIGVAMCLVFFLNKIIIIGQYIK